jgi:hypothetical protein
MFKVHMNSSKRLLATLGKMGWFNVYGYPESFGIVERILRCVADQSKSIEQFPQDPLTLRILLSEVIVKTHMIDVYIDQKEAASMELSVQVKFHKNGNRKPFHQMYFVISKGPVITIVSKK